NNQALVSFGLCGMKPLLLILSALAICSAPAADPLVLWPEKITSRQQWEEKVRPEILRKMQEVMGPLPGNEKRCDLDPRIEEETDCGSYVRRFLTYQSEPGSRVPAYL